MDLHNLEPSSPSSASSTELRKMLTEAGIGRHADLGSQSLTSLGDTELLKATKFRRLRKHGLEMARLYEKYSDASTGLAIQDHRQSL